MVILPEATNDTIAFANAATSGVRRVWRSGYRYSKAGLVTVDLVLLAGSQRALPSFGAAEPARSAALMVALDACNARRDWSTKFEMRSPRYTTQLKELPVVGAA